MHFNVLVDEVRELSLEEKLEMRTLLDKYVAEEERQEIGRNYQESLDEARQGRLGFTSDLDQLRKTLEG